MLEAYVRETENATECSTADVDDRLRNLDNLRAALRQTLQVHFRSYAVLNVKTVTNISQSTVTNNHF